MDACVIGIDVSKDRLDVHVLARGGTFAVARGGAGIIATAQKLLTILKSGTPWQIKNA